MNRRLQHDEIPQPFFARTVARVDLFSYLRSTMQVPDSTYPIHIYVLELEDGYWYVGKTHHPDGRYRQHLGGKGAEWTKLHKVVRCVAREVFYVETEYDEDKYENQATIRWMEREGWQKVRGGLWCEVSEEKTLRKLHRYGYFRDVRLSRQEFAPQSQVRYVLELREGKYYVGSTRDLKRMLRKHEYGRGAEWTKKYKPVGLVRVEPFSTPTGGVRNRRDLDPLVIECFRLYGYENVRGGSFSAVDEDAHLDTLIKYGITVE